MLRSELPSTSSTDENIDKGRILCLIDVNSNPTFMECIITDDEILVEEFDMPTDQQLSEYKTKDEPKSRQSSDPRTRELATPTMNGPTLWLLPGSTGIVWWNEKETMSSRHLWWGLPAPTFWPHCVKVAQMSRWCSWFSWIFVVWCITNSYQRDRMSIQNTFCPFWSVCVGKAIRKGQIRGRAICVLETTIVARGTYFDSIEAIKKNSWKELKPIPQGAFKKYFEDWNKFWHMWVASMGPTLKVKK